MPRKTKPLPSTTLYGGRLNRSLLPVPESKDEKPKCMRMAMSVEDMADELSIGRNVAYQLVQQPGFPSFMIGRRVLVSRKGLQEWIERKKKKDSDDIMISES